MRTFLGNLLLPAFLCPLPKNVCLSSFAHLFGCVSASASASASAWPGQRASRLLFLFFFSLSPLLLPENPPPLIILFSTGGREGIEGTNTKIGKQGRLTAQRSRSEHWQRQQFCTTRERERDVRCCGDGAGTEEEEEEEEEKSEK